MNLYKPDSKNDRSVAKNMVQELYSNFSFKFQSAKKNFLCSPKSSSAVRCSVPPGQIVKTLKKLGFHFSSCRIVNHELNWLATKLHWFINCIKIGPISRIMTFSNLETIGTDAILFDISSFFRNLFLSKIENTEIEANWIANQIQTLWREASAFSTKIHFYFQILRWWKKWNKPNYFLMKSMNIITRYENSVM